MPRDARATQNMQFFRDVNEGTGALEAGWFSGEPIAFVCECAELGCRAPVYLTIDEFRQVRDTPGHFIAAPEHVDSETERVVRATSRYVVLADAESATPAGSAA